MIQITKKLLSDWFYNDNHLYFNDELRKPNFVISSNRSRFSQFRPYTWTVEISTAWVRSERDYHNTFLHELCHLYVRQKYGSHVQSHGLEWKSIAYQVTRDTIGVYGTIQRVCGGQDKYELRDSKTEKFVVFTSYKDILSIAKYSNDDYVKNLKKFCVIKSGTVMYFFTSNDKELGSLRVRKSNAGSLTWNRLPMTLDEMKKRCQLVSKEFYSTLSKAG